MGRKNRFILKKVIFNFFGRFPMSDCMQQFIEDFGIFTIFSHYGSAMNLAFKVPKIVNFLFFEKTNLKLCHISKWAIQVIPSQMWAYLKFGRWKCPNLAIWHLPFLECLMLEFKSEAEMCTKLSNQNSKTNKSFHCAHWRSR